MLRNPYAETILMMRNEGSKNNPPMLQLGEVKSISPIQIIIGELPLNESNLYINKQLLGYTETATINGNTQIIVHESTIAVNDTAILYPVENGQKYILLGVV